MPETIDGKPIWGLAFDKNGDINPDEKSALIEGVESAGLTDLVLFSHGWNNDERAAKSLYERWFHLLSAQLGAGRSVGYVGIRWPAQLWRDEPIPDFGPSPQPDHGGAAAATMSSTFSAGPATIDAEQLADLKELFPNAKAELDSVAALLAAPTAPDTPEKLFEALREFSKAAGESLNDGEADSSDIPGMLDAGQDPRTLFEKFAARLSDAGVRFETGDGAAGGIGDFGAKLLHGAKEALRQASYWQMKNRAGVVGKNGVGPVIAELGRQFPNLRIHLIGHSFGARVVSFALDGLPARVPLRSRPSPYCRAPIPGSPLPTRCRSAHSTAGGHWRASSTESTDRSPSASPATTAPWARCTRWPRWPPVTTLRRAWIRWRHGGRWVRTERSTLQPSRWARSATSTSSSRGRSSTSMPPTS